MSAEGGPRSGRRGGKAVQLPCGHEVDLEGSPILIEMSAAILDHQRGCSRSDFDSGPSPWAPMLPQRDPLAADFLPDLF